MTLMHSSAQSRSTTPAVATLAIASVAVRVFGRKLASRGVDAVRWSAGLGALAAAIKLIEICWRVHRRQLPLTRTLLPALIVIELLRIATGSSSRFGLLVVVGAFELALMAYAIWVLRSQPLIGGEELDERLERVFALFIPERVAELAAKEVTLLWEGLRWAASGFRCPSVEGFGYVEQSLFAMLPLLIPMASVGDEIAVGILARNASVWIRTAIIVVDIWAILWSFGMYVTFRKRPHVIRDGHACLRRGLLGRCDFSLDRVVEANVTNEDDRRRGDASTANLSLKGSPQVHIHFASSVVVKRFAREPRACDALLVSADDPAALCRALKQGVSASAGGR
jgi:hypothetical protein